MIHRYELGLMQVHMFALHACLLHELVNAALGWKTAVESRARYVVVDFCALFAR